MFNFCPFEKLLEPLSQNLLTDVIGKVIARTGIQSRFVLEVPQRFIELALEDTRGQQLRCTLWGDYIEKFNESVGAGITNPILIDGYYWIMADIVSVENYKDWYLELPLSSHRISGSDYAPLFMKIDAFLGKWSTLKISYARKLELIRAVIQGVESFWLQAFPVQKTVLNRITTLCRDFLWGSKFAKVAWADICKPKNEGGLGLRDAETWNNALLCKAVWNIAAKKDSLWVIWVHTVYLRNECVWVWQPRKRHSVFFKRLAYVRELLVQKLGGHNSSLEVAMQEFCIGDNLCPSKVYDFLRDKSNPKPWMAFIWHSLIPPKCSFTMWLALRGGFLTKTNLEFLGLLMECELCGDGVEDISHLFFGCCVSKQIWGAIRHWLQIDAQLTTLDRVISPTLSDLKSLIAIACVVREQRIRRARAFAVSQSPRLPAIANSPRAFAVSPTAQVPSADCRAPTA
ncbi:unnamed protein product [Cuscuta campestris]|uniref:Reverse transcriptase zinc-binding domain-containing protein n=1 Tax=Cuscuta campestris TaxID=132261 RepID=A0A484NLX3_9ASTE|nr:unnamed protein product [Cuscuta campestris]